MNLIPGILRVTVISNTCKVISNHHHAFDVISVDLVPKRYQKLMLTSTLSLLLLRYIYNKYFQLRIATLGNPSCSLCKSFHLQLGSDINDTDDDTDRGEDEVHGSDGYQGWITVIS